MFFFRLKREIERGIELTPCNVYQLLRLHRAILLAEERDRERNRADAMECLTIAEATQSYSYWLKREIERGIERTSWNVYQLLRLHRVIL